LDAVCTYKYNISAAPALADPCLGQGRGGVWNLLCHGHGPHIPATIACLCLRFATLQAPQTRRGSSHDQTSPQAFPRQLSQLHAPGNASNPSTSLSKATLAATGPIEATLPATGPRQAPQTRRGSSHDQTFPQAFPRQLSQLHAPDNASNPSTGLSKATLAAAGAIEATLAATGHRHCFKLPQAFPRQLSQLQAPAICF